MKKTRMPVLFLGHGSPLNAIEDNAFRRTWQELGRRLPKPDAIVCVSAHWETTVPALTLAENMETIHDFYGFPQELFAVQYPAPGHPSLARQIVELLAPNRIQQDPKRGLDHGAWSVLLPMYPAADIPVVQLSLASRQPGPFHYQLGRMLAPLREQGVLIVASGNLVHNLRLFNWDSEAPYDWASRFDQQLEQLIEKAEHDQLAAFESLGPDARLAIPTHEHFLPLLYALALREPNEPIAFFNAQVLSSISMRSVAIGLDQA